MGSGTGIKGAGAGEYACYSPVYHNSKYFQGCGSGNNDDANFAGSGACYDMGAHECVCGAKCNAELCVAAEGIWSAECPDHCTECNAEAPKSKEETKNEEKKPEEKKDGESKSEAKPEEKDEGESSKDVEVADVESSPEMNEPPSTTVLS